MIHQLFFVIALFHPFTSPAASLQGAVPKEVSELVGTYTGSWTMFGINAKGEIEKKMSWTDSMTAVAPNVKDGLAFVSTSDAMTFNGSTAPPMKLRGREGYILNKDGSLGDYFLETYGQTYKMHNLGNGVWVYSTAAAPQELGILGFPTGASATHVVVKVITTEGGVVTHRISRVTTAKWNDASGNHELQFVSLQGTHTLRP